MAHARDHYTRVLSEVDVAKNRTNMRKPPPSPSPGVPGEGIVLEVKLRSSCPNSVALTDSYIPLVFVGIHE
jgi:hypothetical protein